MYEISVACALDISGTSFDGIYLRASLPSPVSKSVSATDELYSVSMDKACVPNQ